MDFGDVIFFLVFVGIIISNILKHLKKAGKQAPGKETSGPEKTGKKTGWKNVLEQMLEEAKKQMENQAEPESEGSPLKHPTGWEDIITGKSSAKRQPAKEPEMVKTARAPKPPIIIDDLFSEKAVIAPERSYRKVEEKRRAQGKIPAVDAVSAGKIKIPRQMSQADLRTAVVWSEILGKPLGLRDIEG